MVANRLDDVTVVGSEASALYDGPVTEFARFWVMAGSHVIFIVDKIGSEIPVRTCWSWVINNRDGRGAVTINGREIAVRRPLAGLKILQGGNAVPMGPIYGYLHDAYHPEPARLGEGKPGSGLIYRAVEPEGTVERLAVHVLVMDEPSRQEDWSLSRDNECYRATGISEDWVIKTGVGDTEIFVLTDLKRNRAWSLYLRDGAYVFDRYFPDV